MVEILLSQRPRMRTVSEEWKIVAEVLAEYPTPITGDNGISYLARACGAEADGGRWQGWIEFVPLDGEDTVLRSPRETTQPNRVDTEYWATGLSPVYLEGSLRRALNPLQARLLEPKPEPAYDGPAPDFIEAPALRPRESVLNPFSVYQKGEGLLRGQLRALSAWHLVNIAEAYELAPDRNDLDRLSQDALVELIVARVKRRSDILAK
jgi:hypothetical protein